MSAAAGGAAGLTALAAAYFLSQFYRSFAAVLFPALERDIGLSAGDLSDAQGVWLVVFALAQFPVGWALDRIGPRRLSAGLLAIGGGGGAALFAMAQSPFQVTLAMGLIGLGCAPVLMASLYIFGRVLPPARFATASALLIGIGTLGNLAASRPLTELAQAVGWRESLWAIAALSVVIALALGWAVRDPERLSPAAGRGGLMELFRIRALWLLLPMMTVNYAAVFGLRGAWAAPFFTEIYEFGETDLGSATFAMALAMAVGTLAYGPLDRLFGTRKGVVLAGNAVVLAALLLLLWRPSDAAAAAIVGFLMVGMFGVSFPMLMAHGRAFLPAHLLGRGVTFLNFLSVGGAGLLQFWSGAVYRRAQSETALAATPDAAAAGAYDAVFALYALCLAAALAIYAFSRDAPPPKASNPSRGLSN